MKNCYRFGLIGHNTSYSRSIDIFSAIFAIKNLKGSFDSFDIPPSDFQNSLLDVLAGEIDGLSVTIPYKKKVIPFLHQIDPIAKAIEAVNSILIKGEKRFGFNTDCFGFSIPLHPHAEKLKHGTALMLGAGGAAKAALYSLYTDFEVKRFVILGRARQRLELFKESLVSQIGSVEIEVIEHQNYIPDVHSRFDIVVNCTPLGGWNYPHQSPLPNGFDWRNTKIYYDLNYNPDNVISALARKHSLIVIDGSRMLVGQAISSFHLWTGDDVDFEPVYQKVFGPQSV